MIRLKSGISGTNTALDNINHLKTKCRLLYFKTSSYREVNTFHLGYENQTVMLYGAEVLVCSEINTKQINTVWAGSVVLEC
jgi:hypothetical protein